MEEKKNRKTGPLRDVESQPGNHQVEPGFHVGMPSRLSPVWATLGALSVEGLIGEELGPRSTQLVLVYVRSIY